MTTLNADKHQHAARESSVLVDVQGESLLALALGDTPYEYAVQRIADADNDDLYGDIYAVSAFQSAM